MGGAVNRPAVRWALTAIVALVAALNLVLVVLTVTGR
jgi:hypothetical protein